ncbi:MAG: monooxygenase [Chloroflexota bacterium]|nr:monooxygenase [Chloroflexota bacterium]
MKHIGQHAVVIGASMAGLLAAKALADSYEQVTLLERDTFPPPGVPRKGVPQGRHIHVLLARGREILEDFFPGLTQELVAQGAVHGDFSRDARWYDGGHYCQYTSGIEVVAVSRPLLETQVRARLLALPNVCAVEECDVLGLATDEGRTRVTGVHLIRRRAGSAEEVLPADLVVDASGRGSRTPLWLETLGYPRPEESRVQVRISYATRLYRRQAEHLQGDKAVIVVAKPETKRGGAMQVQEGDAWIVTLNGYVGEKPPTDEQNFLAYARSLPAPDIYEVIREAEPLSEVISGTFPASQRRYYEKLARFPEGLLVVGDALCSFNPIYGQGMTVAVLEALALRACLAGGPERLAQRFFKQASKLVDIPWSISVGSDLRFPEVEGKRSPAVQFINWYISKLHVAARHDPAVALAFHRVVNLMAPPPSMLRPGIALRVLWGNLPLAKIVSAGLMSRKYSPHKQRRASM